jgi:hypothetical protein
MNGRDYPKKRINMVPADSHPAVLAEPVLTKFEQFDIKGTRATQLNSTSC